MNIFRTRYRIVRDRYLGFEVQGRRWWFPIWFQCGFVNTHSSVESAKEWLAMHVRKEVWRSE